MELICPDCRKEIALPKGAKGIDLYTCEHCGVIYTVMYIAGFNDGLKARR